MPLPIPIESNVYTVREDWDKAGNPGGQTPNPVTLPQTQGASVSKGLMALSLKLLIHLSVSYLNSLYAALHSSYLIAWVSQHLVVSKYNSGFILTGSCNAL